VVERAAVVRVSGSVEARESAEVAFQVAGRVARVLVEEGQFVRKGQLLAELDAADYLNAERIAAGDAAAARAQLAKAEAGARRQELEQARAAFEQADDEYRRMKLLADRKSLAPNDFKKIETAWRVARQRLDEAEEGARAEDKDAARAQLAKAEANLELSRKRVADTRLASPLDGVVARRLIDPGEMAGAGIPAFAILDINPVRVRAGVPEGEIGKVKAGQTARVRIPSLGGETFTGRVELVSYAAEAPSRTFPVRILVPNPRLTLRAGMVAEASIEGDATVHAITLPGEALVRDPQGATNVFVYFPDKRRVYARRVQVGGALGREVEISGGLSPGDLVVVAGQQLVREGALVAAEEER
jgi:multidrug efflux pump subunit AcrA (membrane-fusion protein)